MRKCPDLSKIELTLERSSNKFGDGGDTELQAIIKDMEDRGLSSAQYFKNLTFIDLTVPALTKPYISFLTNYCPDSVNQLTLKLSMESFYNLIEKVSLDVVLKLAKRLSKIKLLSRPMKKNLKKDFTTEHLTTEHLTPK